MTPILLSLLAVLVLALAAMGWFVPKLDRAVRRRNQQYSDPGSGSQRGD